MVERLLTRKLDPFIMSLYNLDQIDIVPLTPTQKNILKEIKKMLHVMADCQKTLEGVEKYVTVSLMPYSSIYLNMCQSLQEFLQRCCTQILLKIGMV
jgi:hypothetical protein